MALPETQTADTIKTSALKLAGISSPDASQLLDAEQWLRKCLNQFNKAKDFKLLEDEYIRPFSAYTQAYSLPSDYSKILSVKAFSGTFSGVATAGGASSLTLAADEDIDETRIKGKLIFLTSGTNAYQAARCIDYDESTLIATTTPWNTTPAGDEGYLIAESEKTIVSTPRETIDKVVSEKLPDYYYTYNQKLYLEGLLDDSVDQVWVIRYIVDLKYVDLADSRMTTIYNEIEEELVQGVYAYHLLMDNNEKADNELSNFFALLREYKKKDSRQRRIRMTQRGGLPIAD